MSCQFLVLFILLSPTRNIHAEFQLGKYSVSGRISQSVSEEGFLASCNTDTHLQDGNSICI